MLLLFVFINITFPLNYLLVTGIELYVITMFSSRSYYNGGVS